MSNTTFKFGPVHSHGFASLLIVACMFSSTGIAQAQVVPVDKLSGLVSKVVIGDHIQIVNKSGKLFSAQLEGMSATSIKYSSSGRRDELLESDIREIRIKRPERKGDGLLIGLALGALFGGIGGNLSCPHDPECAAIAVPVFLALGAGIGAGAGELVDVATNRYDAIFRASGTAGLHVRLSPVMSKKRKGAAVSFTF